MTAQIETISKAPAKIRTDMLAILASAAIGLGIIVVSGHLQAGALHNAAHDVRHATGFPCH